MSKMQCTNKFPVGFYLYPIIYFYNGYLAFDYAGERHREGNVANPRGRLINWWAV